MFFRGPAAPFAARLPVYLLASLLIVPPVLHAVPSAAVPPSASPYPGHLGLPPGLPLGLGPRHPGPGPHAHPFTSRLAVNPNAFYTTEPAPMGIADFGVDPAGNGYTYNTSAFYGLVQFQSFSVYLGSNSPPTQLSIQLNIVLTFTVGGVEYHYWIQDVSFYDTAANQTSFLNNIWNFSGNGSGMDDMSVSGNGSVFGGQFYYDGATTPGSGATLTYPGSMELLAVARMSAGLPEVLFEYRDGVGWQTYDTVTFPFASGAKGVGFTVDGTQYNPYGLYDDAELILGGPGGGSQTNVTDANLTMALEFYNGHNFQAIPNAFNFGSDTAEGTSGVVTKRTPAGTNGSLSATVNAGAGTLGWVYDKNYASTINISLPVASGTLAVGGVPGVDFVGSRANLTLAPGSYAFDLNNRTGRIGTANATLAKGGYRTLTVPIGSPRAVQFVESGLPSGKIWTVSIGAVSLTSNSTRTTFYEIDGDYGYRIGPLAGWVPDVRTASVHVAGGVVIVNVTFIQVVYAMQFFESGLPANATWTVQVNGQNYSTSGAFLSFPLPNGSFVWRLGVVPGWTAAPSGHGSLSVNGGGLRHTVSFHPFTLAVSIRASGLPLNVAWGIRVGNVWANGSIPTLIANQPNGSYTYRIFPGPGWSSTPDNGSVDVIGQAVNVSVTFAPFRFPVTFHATGLPNGTAWSVSAGGQSLNGTDAGLLFRFANGSYSYSVADVAGFLHVGAPNGSFRVDGGAVDLTVGFVPRPVIYGYLVGSVLPAGAVLRVDGRAVGTSSGSFNVSLLPGPHAVVVSLTGYYPVYQNVTIVGGATTVLRAVHLSPIPSTTGTKPPGGSGGSGASLSSGTVLELEALLAVSAIAGGLAGAVWWRRRRSR